MKKMMMMAAVAVTAMTFTACQNNGKADLKEDVDSIVYNIGISQSQGVKQYATMQLGIDSTHIDEFINGIKEGAINEADPSKDAYMKGLALGKQLQQMAKGLSDEIYAGDSTKSININNLIAGLVDGIKGKATISSEEAFNYVQTKMEPIKRANLEKQFGDNKAAGEKYLAENKKKEGVKTLKSGIQYKVLVAGDGALPTDTSTIKVNYEGRLIDGTVFDSSYERNMPFDVDMRVPRVIPGWVEVLKLMPAGSKWEVVIPENLAYGERNMGRIKPFSTLIFTIEVLK